MSVVEPQASHLPRNPSSPSKERVSLMIFSLADATKSRWASKIRIK